MAKKSVSNPGKKLKQFNDLIAGLGTQAPAGVTELGVEGEKLTVPALVTKLTGFRDLFAAVAKCEDDLQDAIHARDAAEPQASSFLQSARSAVKATLGKTSTDNKAYGITPEHEPPPMTGEQLVARAEKAAATRKARGTLGKKQKEQIHGQVTATPGPVPVKSGQ
jgi:hypothetical protein